MKPRIAQHYREPGCLDLAPITRVASQKPEYRRSPLCVATTRGDLVAGGVEPGVVSTAIQRAPPRNAALKSGGRGII
jgi:hypothetical protein